MPWTGLNWCLRTGLNRSVSLSSVSQPESENCKKMKGDEGWWRVNICHSVSKPQCLSAFRANRWRVKGFCVIHFYNYCCNFYNLCCNFYKYCCNKNAYLWHNSALLGAQMFPLSSNYTEREVILPTIGAISAEKPEVVIWLITSLCQLGYGINPRCWFDPWRFQKCVVVLKTWNGLLCCHHVAYDRVVATIVVIIIFDCKIIILYNV